MQVPRNPLIDALNTLVYACHKPAVDGGWWTDLETGLPKDRNAGELIALIHSELSEMLEGVRKSKMDDHLPHLTAEAVEGADTLIRLFDYFGGRKIDVATAFIEKLAYNAQRADHKIANRKLADGKKF